MYLLDEMKTPSFATFGNFIRNELTTTIEQIFIDVNAYIFEQDHVVLNHAYIDGTKSVHFHEQMLCLKAVFLQPLLKNISLLFISTV